MTGLSVGLVWPSGARWWLFLLRSLANSFVYPGLKRVNFMRHRLSHGAEQFRIE